LVRNELLLSFGFLFFLYKGKFLVNEKILVKKRFPWNLFSEFFDKDIEFMMHKFL